MDEIYIRLPDKYGSLKEGKLYSIDDLLEEIERLQDLVEQVQMEYDDYVDYIKNRKWGDIYEA